MNSLKRTVLYSQHIHHGAKMVPFAGYEMPAQYSMGVLKEHQWTRGLTSGLSGELSGPAEGQQKIGGVGLFDVSHMGQVTLVGGTSHEDIARALELLVPSDILNLKPGQARYTVLLNENGGIEDDIIVTRPEYETPRGALLLVVNAARKDHDYAYITDALHGALDNSVALQLHDTKSLIAVQGPHAENAMTQFVPTASGLAFMTSREDVFALPEGESVPVRISRSGYTGEDGFEISVDNEHAPVVLDALLTDERAALIGLGARDSLRIEAGLCLYGSDIDESTSPIEASLRFMPAKRRRENFGENHTFRGAERIMREFSEKNNPPPTSRRRAGLRVESKSILRAGASLADAEGRSIGAVTAGTFAPSLGYPIAMAYVPASNAAVGSRVFAEVRGERISCVVTGMPFYIRK